MSEEKNPQQEKTTTENVEEPNIEKEIEDENNAVLGNERQIVVFKIGDEDFGVNVDEVREITRMEKITDVPNSQDFIKGVINLRGGIIVVIDLAIKLGLAKKDETNNTRIIVIEKDQSTVGMVVDSATEVHYLTKDQIKPAPSIVTEKLDSVYIEGVGVLEERLLILLNLSEIIKNIEESAKQE